MPTINLADQQKHNLPRGYIQEDRKENIPDHEASLTWMSMSHTQTLLSYHMDLMEEEIHPVD